MARDVWLLGREKDMPLYEVAILEEPTKKQRDEEGRAEVLAFGPKAIVARDPQSAGIAAILDNEGDLKIDRSRMKVIVRPFG